MAITHIEVTNAKANSHVQTGQLLKVIRETPSFFWVNSFSGTPLKISKKTQRIIGTEFTFFKTSYQPQTSF